jgi:hypothetical protein
MDSNESRTTMDASSSQLNATIFNDAQGRFHRRLSGPSKKRFAQLQIK